MRERVGTTRMTFHMPVTGRDFNREALMRFRRDKTVSEPQMHGRLEPRWLVGLLFALVGLCVLLGAVTWWRLLSPPF